MRQHARHRRRVVNTLLSGAGANTTVDRGAVQEPSFSSSNPYYNNNFITRYRQYVNLYETSWEARKIIDIPIDDAMRQPTIREGLTPEEERVIAEAWQELGVERQLRRAMKQERLLGGSVLLGIFLMQEGEELAQPLTTANIMPGDLQAINVIDLPKLARGIDHYNPFSAEYDRVTSLLVSGLEVHASRMVIFDGNALFGRNSQRLLRARSFSPLGFGESKLAPLWDILMRSLGTQQGAYQLVNVASIMLMLVDNLRQLKATDGGADEKLQGIMRQLSIYNSAVLEGKDIRVESISPSFGSVPELVLTFTQFLAAASDIPITRFMGSSAGGLNATGEGDARNYYDMVDSIRNNIRKPAEHKLLEWLGSSLWGPEVWKEKSKNLSISYEPLWNLDAVQQATRDEIIIRTITSMYQAQLISAETAVAELRARELFETQIEAEQALMDTSLDAPDLYGEGADDPADGRSSAGALA